MLPPNAASRASQASITPAYGWSDHSSRGGVPMSAIEAARPSRAPASAASPATYRPKAPTASSGPTAAASRGQDRRRLRRRPALGSLDAARAKVAWASSSVGRVVGRQVHGHPCPARRFGVVALHEGDEGADRGGERLGRAVRERPWGDRSAGPRSCAGRRRAPGHDSLLGCYEASAARSVITTKPRGARTRFAADTGRESSSHGGQSCAERSPSSPRCSPWGPWPPAGPTTTRADEPGTGSSRGGLLGHLGRPLSPRTPRRPPREVTLPNDICSLLTADEVGSAVGATVTLLDGAHRRLRVHPGRPARDQRDPGRGAGRRHQRWVRRPTCPASPAPSPTRCRATSPGWAMPPRRTPGVPSFGGSTQVMAGGVVDRGTFLEQTTLSQATDMTWPTSSTRSPRRCCGCSTASY